MWKNWCNTFVTVRSQRQNSMFSLHDTEHVGEAAVQACGARAGGQDITE